MNLKEYVEYVTKNRGIVDASQIFGFPPEHFTNDFVQCILEHPNTNITFCSDERGWIYVRAIGEVDGEKRVGMKVGDFTDCPEDPLDPGSELTLLLRHALSDLNEKGVHIV